MGGGLGGEGTGVEEGRALGSNQGGIPGGMMASPGRGRGRDPKPAQETLTPDVQVVVLL